MKSLRWSRRDFIKRTALSGALVGLPGWFVEQTLDTARAANPPSANDKPNIALIGCGGQGRYDTQLASYWASVVAVCDVDSTHAKQASEQFKGAKIYSDFRKLLERDDLHAVITATPDHWHTLVNLAAVKAGKDVYGEKPLTLTIDEGRHLIKAVRDNKRIFQVGSQQRSDPKFRLACELVRNGRLGKLQQIIVSLPAGPHGGPFSPSPVPDSLDWNFWQGQAPERQYVPQRCHSQFRYWLEYSGGTMTDWGAHHNDIALWGIGLENSGPVSIEGKRMVEVVPGGFTAPEQYQVDYVYANGVTHRCQSTTNNGPDGSVKSRPSSGELPHGVKFLGTDGWIFVTRGKIEASSKELIDTPLTNKKVSLYASDNHMGNFFDCLRSRKDTICPAEVGHRSVSLCHLGVLAIRLGRKLNWDPAQEQFVNDAEANSYVAREQRKPFTYDMV